VVLEAHDVLQSQGLSQVGGLPQGSLFDGVGKVEADQGGPAVSREKSRAAISVHRMANGLSLPMKTEILNSLSMPNGASDIPQHRAGGDVEHLPHAVGGVVFRNSSAHLMG